MENGSKTLVIDGQTGQEWLAEFFEFELCYLCEQDADRHIAAPDMFGKWHAFCTDGGE